MKHLLASIFIFLFVITIQLTVYLNFIQPTISGWGATNKEVHTKLIGDDIAPYIISTRAININAPISELWTILTQLGADRAGFFAYTFLEEILGFKTISEKDLNKKVFSMAVGRVVPTTINKNDKYSFPVVLS